MSKRVKVSKACDYCRDKKLKCNGAVICERCSKLKIECTYNYIEKKRVRKLIEVNSPVENEDVNSRLDRIESLLTSLVHKMEHEHKPIIKELPQEEAFEETNSPDEQIYNGQYFGSYCSFSIFSPKGISYITSKTNDPNSMDDVLNVLKKSYYILYKEYKSQIELNSSDLSLPNIEISKDLISWFLMSKIYQIGIITEEEINVKFMNYINGEVLKNSDYCILHLIISFGALNKLENDILNNQEIELYKSIEFNQIKNALVYFHKLTVFSDNINGIKSIIFLIFYFQNSLIPDMEYLLISSIIRFSQSIGLHRKESLGNVNDFDYEIKQRIFLNCYIFDKELCLKSGKPLIINDHDVSSLNINEGFIKTIEQEISLQFGEYDRNNKNHLKEFLIRLSEIPFGITKYFEILNLKIAKLSSLIYNNLFSANNQNKSKFEINSILNNLNNSFIKIIENLPKFIKPGYKISIPNIPIHKFNYNDLIYSNVLKFQLFYHLNLMNLNKIGMNKKFDILNSKNLCLNSSREIIRINSNIKLNDNYLYFYSLFIILSSNITLLTNILENNELDIREDLKLMSRLFNYKKLNYLKFNLINKLKFLLINYIIKNFINIGIKINQLDDFKNEDIEFLKIELNKTLMEIDKNDFDNLLLNNEVFDLNYFSQQIFNIPNFIIE